MYTDSIVGILKVKLSIDLSSRQAVKDLTDKGKGSTVLDSIYIQRPVVDNYP
jgi:hypothetical protein